MTATPASWRSVAFPDAFEVVSDQGLRVAQRDYLRAGALRVVDQGAEDDPAFTDDLDLQHTGELPVLVFGDHTRRIKYVDHPFAVGAQGVKLLRPRPGIEPRFAYWLLKFVRLDDRGYGRHFALLRAVSFPVPPIEEQRRIVDLLEDHHSRLDAADGALDAAQRRVAALEQTVLADVYAQGEPAQLGALAEIQGGIQKQPKRTPADNAFPFLRVANVTSAGLDLREVHQIELFSGELEKLRLRAGDLLVVEGNGSASQIGRSAIWDGSIRDCVHQNHLIRVRAGEAVSPAFLEAVWNSPQNRRELTEVASSTSGLHTLSVAKLKRLQIPLLPPSEQEEAVAAVAEIRATRRRLQLALVTAAGRSAGLRRSLLATAFSGGLTSESVLESSDV